MLDERKVKLMTRLALYEQTQGKEDFKVSEYYRKDYVGMHILFSVFWSTFGYACIVGLFVLAEFKTLMEGMSMRLLLIMGVSAIGGYLAVVIVYAIITSHIYNKKHKDARQRVKKYNHDLTRLLKIYEKERK